MIIFKSRNDKYLSDERFSKIYFIDVVYEFIAQYWFYREKTIQKLEFEFFTCFRNFWKIKSLIIF